MPIGIEDTMTTQMLLIQCMLFIFVRADTDMYGPGGPLVFDQ